MDAPDISSVLVKSLYGTRQSDKLWGSVIDNYLKEWWFTISELNLSLYFMRNGDSFIIFLLVVHEMAFSSN